jgi:2',3'-cyclic-nucleotide 2'-phosphodiesterase (5'-nucleotidase family)/predicted extracellular nuclease
MPVSKRISWLSALALVASGLLLVPSVPAQASSTPYTDLMISEVYGGDGSGGATYHYDYVELFNPTSSPVTVAANSLYLSYASSANTTGSAPVVIPATTIPAYTHYLIETHTGTGANPVNQHPPHVDVTIAMSDIAGAGGKVFLQNTSTAQAANGGDVTGNSAIIDAISASGLTAKAYEGTEGTVAGGATNSLQRKDDVTHGYLDTNTTSSDLKAATPTPKGTADGPLPLGGTSPLAAASPGNKTGVQGRPITGFTLSASGGTSPYQWSATGTPAGVSVSAAGAVSGTPTEAGSFSVTATVTDAASATAQTTFTMTVVPTPPTANHVVISEVWGDGGFTGAPFKNSFVELYNPTNDAISLAGSALAYLPSSNNGTIGTTQRVNLAGSIPAKGYYLISGYSNGSAGEALPASDATTTINWHYQNGTIALLDTQSAFSIPGGDLAGVEHVTDAVGYGGNTAYVPVAYEGAPTGTNTGLAVSAVRSPVEADSNNNSVDFTTDSPTPTNSAGVSGGGSTVCDPSFPATATIAQIQGTGSAAAGNNCTVTTEGVVTGIFKDVSWAGASSGFDGMYIQTGGTGGTSDATPGASDAIFVFGDNATPADVEIGDSVRVTGKVNESGRLTRITAASGGVVELGTALPAVTPLEIAYPATEAGREAQEGMLLSPTGTFTVTNAYGTNGTGEVGLASGSTPLKQPSEFADATDDGAMQAIRDENAQRAVTLDDGAGINYLQNQTTKAQPVPYLTGSDGNANPAPPRVGAEAYLHSAVLFDFRDGAWKFQPPSPVFLDGADIATFEDTRAQNLVPQDVGGDLTIATFNVLNYFNTTGEAYSLAGPLQNPPLDTFCTYYNDRGPGTSKRIGNDSCGVRLLDDPDTTKDESQDNDGRGPRGAATAESLARQEAKLANTIEALNADVIALEEIENSIKLPGETNRDDAVSNLVRILNDQAGETKWAYVRSPGEALTAANIAEQDTIRPAFIYQVDSVETVGKSDILFGTTEFANAREPLAQVFKAKDASDDDGFAVIVNHFKSKGDNAAPAPKATGDNANHAEVGAFNGDRKRQAARLLTFADAFAESRDVDAVFLAGDFNSYTMEEPIQILTAPETGFELVESDQEGDESYSYNGLSGSLDHVLGNVAARAMVTGADIWEINANEAASFMYSRYNYNVTDFWQPELPFGTSDHNPEVVGIDVPDVVATPTKKIQIIATNDFHGRLLPDGGNAAGAAPFATAVKELKSAVPDSIFVAAGDLVGASTFESFIQDDEPTIDALNAMDLEVSAAGNHEFDRGYEDFVGRIQDRAQWEYIAANVNEPAGRDDLAETFTKTFGEGDDAVTVGFVGAVTEDLPALVNPAGIAGVTVSDVVDSTNAAAAELKDAGADLVVLLVHEGSPSTECSSMTDPATTWGNIVQNTSSDVDAIISGHTHLAYNCRFPVADWSERAVTKRPVVSAGQYGTNLNQLVFKFDEASGDLIGINQDVVATAGVGYTPDTEVKGIVDAAVAYADEAGAEVLGKMSGQFKRAAYQASGVTTENRGGESTLNNQVAEVQRWATDADLAFMNPGGLRADMLGTASGSARDLTYRQAADVQPFANTLVKLTLTGAQIEKVLEQQWQRNAQGGVPSRPFLRLGISKGFTYTYVQTPETVSAPNSAPVNTFKGEVTGMWLDGVPISQTATYSVTANSFLGGGGDNFWELANGTDKVDTGKIDLEAMVDYMAQYESSPLPVDYSQRGVEVTFPGGAPATYQPGSTVSFSVASWAMSAADDLTDTAIQVKLGDQVLGTAPVTITPSTKPYDNIGTAAVSVQLPAGVNNGKRMLTLVGATTGTQIRVPIQVDGGIEDIQVIATNDFHGRILNEPNSAAAGAAVLSGAVKQLREANPNTVFAAAGDLIGATTFESFVANDKPTIDALNEAGLEVSAVGNHELDQGYDDLINRVMADDPQGGANWEYIAANLIEPAGSDEIAPSWVREFGDVKVGFVGAVTEALPTLVSPTGIEDLEVASIVDSVNAEAGRLVTEEDADLVIMLVHEGAPSTDCATMDDSGPWAEIINNVTPDVDAIVSGHTHLAYNCKFPVPEWAGDAVTERPVVSAGQYGEKLNQLVFKVDSTTGEIVAQPTQTVLNLKSCNNSVACTNYPADPEVTPIVTAAVDAAAPIGAQVLGPIQGPFNRAKLANGTTENRGGESTLGNLVAEVQRAETPEEQGGAQIAFMNPGGLRAEMEGTVSGGVRSLTYRQAANVQPFANGLVNMDLTGAQIEKVLEQQWSRTPDGTQIPSGLTRYFLRLGVSKGFTYTYREVPAPAVPVQGGGTPVDTFTGEVTGMWLNGEPIDPEETYSVTVNSFLAGGGDSFWELRNGQDQEQWGVSDLQAITHYMAENTEVGGAALPVDYSQRAVEVHNLDASYTAGERLTFDVESWSLSNATDVKDTAITVMLGAVELGTATLDNSVSSVAVDKTGKASVDVAIPASVPGGPAEITLVGASTGTEITVPIEVEAAAPQATVAAGADQTIAWGQATSVDVTVSGNLATATGTVRLFEGSTPVGSAVALAGGSATLPLAARSLEPGTHSLRVVYSGDDTYDEAEDTVVVTVEKAAATVTAGNVSITYGQSATVAVSVGGGATGKVEIRNGGTTLASGDLVNGSVQIAVPGLEPGTYGLTAAYLGDDHVQAGSAGFTVTVAKVTPTVTAGNVSATYGQASTVTVNVGSGATGTVRVLRGSTVLGTGTVSGGSAQVTLPATSLTPGTYTLTAAYSGDGRFAAASASFSASIAKAGSTTKVTASPAKTRVDGARVTLRITVAGKFGVDETGKVKVTVPGQGTETVTLENGRATLKLEKFTSPGKKTVRVEYLGSALLKGSTDKVTITVTKSKKR